MRELLPAPRTLGGKEGGTPAPGPFFQARQAGQGKSFTHLLTIRKVNCRAATALRMAAQSLHHSKSALGDFYRRMRAKLGAQRGIAAVAHKLARIIFHLISTRQEFDDSKFAADQLRNQRRQEIKLRCQIHGL